MTGRRYPDFFIIGAPKCGTTAIYSYLSDCRDIFMPANKEPNHFNSDLQFKKSMVRNTDDYMSLFLHAPNTSIWGEASAYYLYSSVAASRILKANPSAKFVAILRDPVKAVFSFHKQMLTVLCEDIPSCEDAWLAQAERLCGKRIPSMCFEPALLQYGSVYDYAVQLRRLFALAKREQVHVMIYEEFFSDPARHYAGLLQFLGVRPDGRTHFPVVYPARELRSIALARFYFHPPEALRNAWLLVRDIFSVFGFHPVGFLRSLNERVVPSQALTARFEGELRAHFARDISEIEMLLERKIEHWRTPQDVDLKPTKQKWI